MESEHDIMQRRPSKLAHGNKNFDLSNLLTDDNDHATPGLRETSDEGSSSGSLYNFAKEMTAWTSFSSLEAQEESLYPCLDDDVNDVFDKKPSYAAKNEWNASGRRNSTERRRRSSDERLFSGRRKSVERSSSRRNSVERSSSRRNSMERSSSRRNSMGRTSKMGKKSQSKRISKLTDDEEELLMHLLAKSLVGLGNGDDDSSVGSSSDNSFQPEDMMGRSLAQNTDMIQSQEVEEEEPNLDEPRTDLEISPGEYMPLRGSAETWDALEKGFIQTVNCWGCQCSLDCIRDAQLVICPECRTLSPIPNLKSDDSDENPVGGVSLGVKSFAS